MNIYKKYFEQLKEEVKFFPETVNEFFETFEKHECDLDEMDLLYCIHNLDEEIKMLRKLMRKIKKEVE